MTSCSPIPPAGGPDRPTEAWGAKAPETVRRKRSLHHRPWFRALVLGLIAAGGLAGAAGLWKLDTWHTERRAAVEEERKHVAAFIAGEEFAAFTRAADAQLVAALNFAVARPTDAAAAAPAAAAWEKEHRELPWALQLQPLPVSAAANPARVFAAGREATALLARHGFTWDEPIRQSGRKLLLRLLVPYARAFSTSEPEHALREVWRDPSLQDQVIIAFGARTGSATPREDAEKLFAFYALVGPRMWRAIEATAPSGKE